MDLHATKRFIETVWADSIVPTLQDYVKIPNQSPAFDPKWQESGYMDQAVALIADWVRAQRVPGLRLEVVRLEGRTPLLFFEVPGNTESTVLLYGHLDKQPPMHGWKDGLGPWTPVIRDGKLYGRGAADDGYASFAAVTAIKALQIQGEQHARCVVLIEACEESASYDLPAYMKALADRIGTPSLVVCLDSGCDNYDQLWVTTSLRGLLSGNLTVSTLTEGVHSGAAGGIVPSSFRVIRHLLSRLEDEYSGEIRAPQLHVEIPAERRQQANAAADVLGSSAHASFPFHPETRPVTLEVPELLLNRAWRPTLEITGAEGFPTLEQAGNVLRPVTTLKLSLRLPPTLDAHQAARHVTEILEGEPLHGARVEFKVQDAASGWHAPAEQPWLSESVERASTEFFGRAACYRGEGGSIPFMAMLGEQFPEAQFVITGVLGPQSNAHGPNEFLHIATGTKVTGCVARVLSDHYRANS